MRIPKSIQVHGKTYNVKMTERAAPFKGSVAQEIDGLFNNNKCEITIAKRHRSGTQRNQQDLERTYFHELIHCILCEMNEDELYVKEEFVDEFARLLHQTLVTARYR